MATLDDLADDPELSLAIPLRSIYEEFSCPICYNNISECHMTPCGHNFCRACILECLNRKHQCPCCNEAATRDALRRNHAFDKLLAIVVVEKERASKDYFTKLINNSGGAAAAQALAAKNASAAAASAAGVSSSSSSSSSTTGTATTTTTTTTTTTAAAAAAAADSADEKSKSKSSSKSLSPIEQLFHKHMRSSLVAYEQQHQELAGAYHSRVADTKNDYAARLARLSGGGGDTAAVQRTRDELATRLDELRATHERQERLLLDSYSTFLADSAPRPAALPVVVRLSIPSKRVVFDDVTLAPDAGLAELRALLQARLRDASNAMTSTFTKSNVFVMRRPFSDAEVLMVDERRPLAVQYRIPPGAELALKGDVALESDAPKECFTARFTKGNAVDYFSCKDCKFNWVCDTCAHTCHAGHSIAPYLQNHKPDWACCYCVKHKKCTIVNKNNVGK